MNRVSAASVWLALAVGIALTFWGIAHLVWPDALSFGRDGLPRYLAFLLVCTLLTVLVSRWRRLNPTVVGCGIGVGLALISGALWPLIVTLWFAFSSAVLGRMTLSAILGNDSNENWLMWFLVGAGIFGTLIGLLAHFPVNYAGVYGAVLMLPLIVGRHWLLQMGHSIKIALLDSPKEFSWLDVFIVVIALVHFVVALMPEVGHDALAMHLFIPAHLFLRQQWGFDVTNYVWAVMPMLGDWIFSLGFMLGGETASRLINFGFIMVLAWLTRDIVLLVGGSTLGVRWGVLIFLSTPLTFTESSSLFIESVWSAFLVAGILTVLRVSWAADIQRSEVVIAGCLLGFASAAKAVTFSFLPVLLLPILWCYKVWFNRSITGMLIVGLGGFLFFGLIPYITSWWLTGNPVFPFFNKVFQSHYWPPVNFEPPAVFEKGLKWDVLYQMTFHSGKYLESRPGSSGFQWLLLFLPIFLLLLVCKHRKGITLLAVGGLATALVFHSTAYLRYIFPVFAVFAAAIGVGMSLVNTSLGLKRVLQYMALFAVALNLFFLNAAAFYSDFPLNSVLSKSNREQYLLGRLPIRAAVGVVNEMNIGRSPVAVFGPPMTAGLASNGLYANWYNYEFQARMDSVKTEQDIVDSFMASSVDFVILDSGWSGGNEKMELIKQVTEKVAEFGGVAVRRVKEDYRFKTEMLVNADLMSITGWSLGGEARYHGDEGIISVSVSSPAIQVISVSPSRRYLNNVTARCDREVTQGRVQVNWLDARDNFIMTNIRTFDCAASWETHSMEVTAPSNAVKAVVYATGHTNTPLQYKSISFRR